MNSPVSLAPEFDLKTYLSTQAARVDAALERLMPSDHAAYGGVAGMMEYAMFPGGKRFRPVLTLATAEALGVSGDRVLPTACAFEMVHGFSLVHDDLPCMDNDAVRRGKPSCHKQYGEAEALLAGDAMIIDAFRLVADNALVEGVSPQRVVQVVGELAEASGWRGMVGGQMLDIQGMRQSQVDADVVVTIHRAKTGALIRGAVRAGALLADATPQQLSDFTEYAERLGLVFQITDDILDFGEKEESVSYPAIYGLEEARRLAEVATAEALEFLASHGEAAEPLRALARYLLVRTS